MSEPFNPQWQLEMNNKKEDGFLNGWWVDVDELCGLTHPTPIGAPLLRGELSGLRPSLSGCVLNMDGSYNLEIVIWKWLRSGRPVCLS
ncbi:MAG: hypothetical protein KAI71_05910 [Candidatus Pacebacteria bacterium]|nr:hypothetical protein [Candidatus Paceibacterota bacterium]